LKTIVKETESQRNKIHIFQAKIEELEQHVGILANNPDPLFEIMPPSSEHLMPQLNVDHTEFIEEKLLNANLNWGVDENQNRFTQDNIIRASSEVMSIS